MPAPITDDLLELMSDTVVAQPGTLDSRGQWTASGEALQLPAYISGKTRLVRDPGGREVVSTLKATVVVTVDLVNRWIENGWSGWIDEAWISGDSVPAFLTTDTYRYTLPARFSPRSNLVAMSVGHAADENGYHHDAIYFP